MRARPASRLVLKLPHATPRAGLKTALLARGAGFAHRLASVSLAGSVRELPWKRYALESAIPTLKAAPRLGLPLFVMSTITIAVPLFAQSPASPAFTLEWSAPSECPSSAEVLAETQHLLGGAQSVPSGERWAARAVVSHEGGWSVSIQTSSESGVHERTLHAQTCRGLADATALILALAIDPERVAVATAAPASESSSPAAPPTTATVTVPPPSSGPSRSDLPVQASRRTVHYFVGVPVSVSAGILPGIDYGVGFALTSRIDSVLLEVSVDDWLRPVVATIPGSSAGGTFGLVSGTLYACNGFGIGAFAIGPCAQVDVGRIEAKGFGVTSIGAGSALWLAAGAGAIGVAALDTGGTWAIPIHLDFVVPLERRDFVIQNVGGVVFHQPQVAGRAAIELRYRFW
jgi:hypothetical protein